MQTQDGARCLIGPQVEIGRKLDTAAVELIIARDIIGLSKDEEKFLLLHTAVLRLWKDSEHVWNLDLPHDLRPIGSASIVASGVTSSMCVPAITV